VDFRFYEVPGSQAPQTSKASAGKTVPFKEDGTLPKTGNFEKFVGVMDKINSFIGATPLSDQIKQTTNLRDKITDLISPPKPDLSPLPLPSERPKLNNPGYPQEYFNLPNLPTSQTTPEKVSVPGGMRLASIGQPLSLAPQQLPPEFQPQKPYGQRVMSEQPNYATEFLPPQFAIGVTSPEDNQLKNVAALNGVISSQMQPLSEMLKDPSMMGGMSGMAELGGLGGATSALGSLGPWGALAGAVLSSASNQGDTKAKDAGMSAFNANPVSGPVQPMSELLRNYELERKAKRLNPGRLPSATEMHQQLMDQLYNNQDPRILPMYR
jgi:hypothetical protein